MLIQIASTRFPKINGVKKAVHSIAKKFQIPTEEILFETTETNSGVSDTPKSIEELMRGAQTRAKNIFQKRNDSETFSVGVEGGLFRISGKVFLQSWTCVYDGTECYFGSSGSIEIPAALSEAVMDNGADLGIVIDGFAEKRDVRSKQGTFGILSDDIISREDSFELATIFAMMPIFNRKVYDRKLNI